MTDWPRIILTLRHRGLRQKDIARKCGVSRSTIVRLELGDHTQPKHALGECLLKLVAETHTENAL